MLVLRPHSRTALARILSWVLLVGGAAASLGSCSPQDGERAPAGREVTAAPAGGPASPCEAPIGWKVGFVDERFGLHGSEVRRAVEEAVALWEGAAGRKLFQHQPVGGMPVDLEYDHRQEQLREQVEAEERLDRWEAELSRRPRTASEVERYNQLVDRYNAALDEYKALPSLEFQVAEYSQVTDPASGHITKRRITVWAVDSWKGLTTALAHELGHALGLAHVGERSALMTGEGEASRDGRAELHAADLAELGRVCGTAR